MKVECIVWNTLKRGGIEKRGVETNILKGRQAGLRVGALKEGVGTPLRIMSQGFLKFFTCCYVIIEGKK